MTQQEQPPRTDALRAALEQCLDYLYGPKDDCCHCCGAIDHIEPTEQHEKWCVVPPARAALAATPSPSSGQDVVPDHVVDRDGLVWRIVHDGGMATRADYTGITSIGIDTLEREHGPLHKVARLQEQER